MWSERRRCGLLAAVVLFGGCATPQDPYVDLINQYGMVTEPAPGRFSVCHSHSCARVDTVSLSDADWATVQAQFAPPALDAAAERRQIAAAIATAERLVAPRIDAGRDRGGNFAGITAGGNQLDCIDESTNSTTYLTLFARQGWLRWHSLERRATRGFMIFGWPHTTAVIREIGSGAAWAVDSWFHDTGEPPEIVPLAQWRDGWSPPGFSNF